MKEEVAEGGFDESEVAEGPEQNRSTRPRHVVPAIFNSTRRHQCNFSGEQIQVRLTGHTFAFNSISMVLQDLPL